MLGVFLGGTWHGRVWVDRGSYYLIADWRNGGKEIIMKTLIVLVAIVCGMILTAEPVLANGCTYQTLIIDGKARVCMICPGIMNCA